jgi:Tol biopolymer transport system component
VPKLGRDLLLVGRRRSYPSAAKAIETHPVPERVLVLRHLLLALAMGAAGGELSAQSPGAAGPPADARIVSFTTGEGTALTFDISPDGRTLAFSMLGQLWTMPAEGGDAVPITNPVRAAADDIDPVFSPDGERIAFQSHRQGEEGLWLVDAATRELTRLSGTVTQQPPNFGDFRWRSKPAWSPDGRWIAFVASELDIHALRTTFTLRIHDLASGGTRPVKWAGDAPPALSDIAWLPNGRHLIYRVGAGWAPGQRDAFRKLDLETGESDEVVAADAGGISPAVSPDGRRLAYFAPDEEGRPQLWTVALDGGEPVRLTDQPEVTPLRVRWSLDGTELLYSAAGRLWRLPAQGGEPTAIPFLARVAFEQTVVEHPPVRFAEPGTERPARGNQGLALSADGQRIAMIAIGRLWVWPVGGQPEPVAELPATAVGLAWSPDGHRVAWAAGAQGAEQLFATDVASGETRQLTELPGRAKRPAWAPDGRQLSFVHALPGAGIRLAVIEVGDDAVADTAAVSFLAPLPGYLQFHVWYETPSWSPCGGALLVFGEPWAGAVTRLVGLDGSVRPLGGFPGEASFTQLMDDSTIVFTRYNQLWRTRIRGDAVTEPRRITDLPAVYPSASRDGAVLHLSDDGYRITTLDGASRALGWPVTMRVRPAPPPVLLRDVRVVDGTGASPAGRHDILLEHGRIARIEPASTIPPPADGRVVEGEGRTAIPGLVDAHFHAWEPLGVAGALYWGITSAQDMGSALARVASFAENIEAGIQLGPRLTFGGVFYLPGQVTHGATRGSHQEAGDSASIERALALLRAMGASYAKMQYVFRLDSGVEFVRRANAYGLRVGGHVAYATPLVAAGIHDQQHALTRFYDDFIQLFLVGGVAVVPTGFAATGTRYLQDDAFLEQPAVRAFTTPVHWSRLRGIIEGRPGAWGPLDVPATREMIARLHRAGVTLGAGSDVPLAPVPSVMHWELEELVAAGLSPMDALLAATSGAARILGAEAEIGTLEVGKRADLLLLYADPLEDIRNTRRIRMVIQGGHIVDRDALIDWARRLQPAGSVQTR